MSTKLDYKLLKCRKTNKRVFYHYFHLGKNLEFIDVMDIMHTMHIHHHYNSNTGIIDIEYVLPKSINNEEEIIFKMTNFIGFGLTEDKIKISDSFSYNSGTGDLIIYQIVRDKAIRPKKVTCDICGRVLENAKVDEDGGVFGLGCNNPDPLDKLRFRVCCDTCNEEVIIPTKLRVYWAEDRRIKQEKYHKNDKN